MKQSLKLRKNAGYMLSILVVLTMIPSLSWSQSENRIRFNGFGDMTAGVVFGDPADDVSKDLFSQYGETSYPLNLNKGFGIVGADLLTTVLITDNLTFQTEINLQVSRGESNEVELDMERVYLDYKISDKFNIQTGLFFTPIGFSNRNLYARAWLMNSIQVRDIVEEETGLVPTHSAGVNFYGTFNLGNDHALNYITSVTNGRTLDPVTVIYNRNDFGLTYTGLLEWNIPGSKDFRIGFSTYYSDNIKTFRVNDIGETIDMTDPASERVVFTELGINPYIWYIGKVFNLFSEMHSATIKETGDQSSGQNLFALTSELSFNLTVKDKKLTPYIRHDLTQMPASNGGLYYGLRADGNELTRHYVPEFNAVMAGIAFDVSSFNRIKIEYIRHLDGPRAVNGITIQTAFGF
jgi:hypothetical protein